MNLAHLILNGTIDEGEISEWQTLLRKEIEWYCKTTTMPCQEGPVPHVTKCLENVKDKVTPTTCRQNFRKNHQDFEDSQQVRTIKCEQRNPNGSKCNFVATSALGLATHIGCKHRDFHEVHDQDTGVKCHTPKMAVAIPTHCKEHNIENCTECGHQCPYWPNNPKCHYPHNKRLHAMAHYRKTHLQRKNIPDVKPRAVV